MRRGQNTLGHGKSTETVAFLHANGYSVQAIQEETGLSYSAIYNAAKRARLDWAKTLGKKLRTPYGFAKSTVLEGLDKELKDGMNMRKFAALKGIPYSSVLSVNKNLKLNIAKRKKR